MNLASSLRASASGLHAERLRLDVISANIANANSVRTPEQEAYKRKLVVLEATDTGVRIDQVTDDPAPLRGVSEPDHPMADAEGMVYYSNVNPIMEMVNLMSATRSYEANVAAFNAAKGMLQASINIGRA